MPHASVNTEPTVTTIAAALPADQHPDSKKRKRKEKPHILHSATFRKTQWSYFHLSLTTPATASLPNPKPSASSIDFDTSHSLDEMTVRTLLRPPMQMYLGLLGSSISIDVLKTEGREAWIRIQRLDAKALRASLTGWVGSCEAGLIPGVDKGDVGGNGRVGVAWRVLGESTFMGLVGGDGRELFEDAE